MIFASTFTLNALDQKFNKRQLLYPVKHRATWEGKCLLPSFDLQVSWTAPLQNHSSKPSPNSRPRPACSNQNITFYSQWSGWSQWPIYRHYHDDHHNSNSSLTSSSSTLGVVSWDAMVFVRQKPRLGAHPTDGRSSSSLVMWSGRKPEAMDSIRLRYFDSKRFSDSSSSLKLRRFLPVMKVTTWRRSQ